LGVKSVVSVTVMKQSNISFFNCQHAKEIWRVIQIATELTSPRSIRHMLENRLTTIAKKD
jgi:hypothetical protein